MGRCWGMFTSSLSHPAKSRRTVRREGICGDQSGIARCALEVLKRWARIKRMGSSERVGVKDSIKKRSVSLFNGHFESKARGGLYSPLEPLVLI